MHDNQLGRETSPYLLQHADNPVAWRAWGRDVLAEAAAADKPILLSVGYAACHWCHVMAHESFEDPATAAMMNDLFVNVKVDREERPDLDTIYQSALALLGEHGGWPLTMFCTPQGEPFWGGTYFPPRPSFGRPGFRDVLATVAQVYRDEPARVQHNVGALRDALVRMTASQPGDMPDVAAIDEAARRLVGEIDMRHGGLGGAPKFPQVPLLRLLWRARRRIDDTAPGDAVTLTLDRMAQGGIYDHLGGGFARYSVDARWLVPHFEKMLYDNAQLVELYAEVWRTTRSPLYARRVEETVDWLLREMRTAGEQDSQAFAATIDADSEGEEGRYYVWSTGEIDAALEAAGLADDAAAFKTAYDVGPLGNWEGRTILNRSATPALGDDAHEARLTRCRAALMAARAGRVPPGRDDKVLADWNGLMIAALAQAATTFARPDWLDTARSAFRFVATTMQRHGRLGHAWRAGRLTLPGTLDDHAEMARAALALHEATGDDDYLDHAHGWVAVAGRHYWDDDDGGYFLSADDAADVITRPKSATDNATPAGNATMVEVLARLSLLTGKTADRERAEATLGAFAGAVARHPLAFATLLNAVALLSDALQVVVIGTRGLAATDRLIECFHSSSSGSRTLRVISRDEVLPGDHPAHAKAAVDGRPTAYVCRGPVCSLPMTEPDALAAELARP